MQNPIDLEQELTFKEVKHFFSKNKEFTVEQEGINIKISFYDKNILEYKPTYQTLIRAISTLVVLKVGFQKPSVNGL